MYFAIGVEPTKLSARTAGWESSVSTAALPPFTNVRTPFGRFRLSISSKTRRIVSGTFSDGFRMKVLPHAMAYGRHQNGISAGQEVGVGVSSPFASDKILELDGARLSGNTHERTP